MIPFPDDSQCPLSADGSEKILGGSVGLNRILMLLKLRAAIDRAPAWGLYLINAATVFRNVHASWKPTQQYLQLSDSEAITLFQNDINLLITYLTSYLSAYSAPTAAQPALMVVYYPNYCKIPPEIRRPLGDKDTAFWRQYEGIRKTKIQLEPERTFASPYLNLWEMQCGAHSLPHVELSRWVQGHLLSPTVNTLYRWGHIGTFMMTHCPLDLHIKIPKVDLIESYWGTVKKKDQFYTKLNGLKDIPVPFNSATHQLFGDSTLIAAKAMRGTKKTLLELAQKHNWMIRDMPYIVADAMKVMPQLLPSDFVKF